MSHDIEGMPPLASLDGWRAFMSQSMPEPPPLLPEEAWRGLSRVERRVYDQARTAYHDELLLVSTPAIRQITTTGMKLIARNTRRQTGRKGLIVSGPSGTGKTTSVSQLGKRHQLKIERTAPVDIPAALRAFHLRYPKVHIVLRDGASKDLVQEVRDGVLDVAFLGVLPGYRPKGVSDHELATGEPVAVVAPAHPLAGKTEVGLERLAKEMFVDYPDGTAARAQSEEAFAAMGLTREVAFEVSGTDFIVRLVRSGLGIAMLPAAFAAELTGVHVLPVRDAPARTERLVWSASGPPRQLRRS
ncbi:LysR substrate-binding domain-containing protein [Streptomyces sp. NPDC002540]